MSGSDQRFSLVRDIQQASRRMAIVSLLFLAFSLCLGAAVYMVNMLHGQYSAMARLSGQDLAHALMFGDHWSATETLAAFANTPEVVEIGVFAADGGRFTHFPAKVGAAIPERLRVRETGRELSGCELYVTEPLQAGGRTVGWMRMKVDLSGIYLRMVLSVLAALVLSGLVVAFASRRLARRQAETLRPLQDLTRVADTVSSRLDFAVRVPVQRADEIGRLAGSFNRMLEEIAVRDARLSDELRWREAFERDLREARDAADQANRIKGEFLANMSHEIRTPINGVIGLLYLLERTRLDARQRDYVRTARQSAQILLTLINDILDFSKIEAGKLELQAAPFDLREMLESTFAFHELEASRKGLELVLDIAADLETRWLGDAERIRQIVNNLLSNAIKFTGHGYVLVRVQRQEDSSVPGRLHVAVTDTGIGLQEEECERLFQSFSQANAGTTKRFGGTGLGLAICRRLTGIMGGHIGVISQPGLGSTFWVTLDVAPLRDAEGTETVPQSVLLVEPLPAAAHAFLENAQRLGLRVIWTTDLAEARRDIADTRLGFHSVWIAESLGDAALSLPAEIRSEVAHGEYVPAFVVLGPPLRERSAQPYRNAGFSAHVAKPLRLAEMGSVLAALAAGSGQFYCRYSLADAQEDSDAQTAQTYPQARVLVAEDNLVNQDVIRGLLEIHGIEPDVVDNGLLAVERVRNGNYNLVFMDCQMPVMDGYEATRRLRAEGCQVPVVALTANAMAEHVHASLEAGMNQHLSKPLEPLQLAQVLDAYLGDGSASPPAPAPVPRGEENRFAEVRRQLRSFPRIARLYLDDLPRRRAEVQAALAEPESMRLTQLLHAFKGTSLSIGATRLGNLLARWEGCAAQGKGEALRVEWPLLDQEIASLEEELGRLLAETPTPEKSAGPA